jgi:hypothetical protein
MGEDRKIGKTNKKHFLQIDFLNKSRLKKEPLLKINEYTARY